jgi:hypothetical protein
VPTFALCILYENRHSLLSHLWRQRRAGYGIGQGSGTKRPPGALYHLPAAGAAQRLYPNIFYHEVQVPTYPLFDYPPYETALASTMVDIIKNNHLQLLHVHYAIPHASAAYMAKKILEGDGIIIPVITTLHGTDITLVGRDKTYAPVVAFSINPKRCHYSRVAQPVR